MIRPCAFCGVDFDAQGSAKTCGVVCKAARRDEGHRKRRAEKADLLKAQSHGRYVKNAARILELSRIRYAQNADTKRLRYAQNAEELREKARAKYAENPERDRERVRRYRAIKVAELSRLSARRIAQARYRANNRDKIRTYYYANRDALLAQQAKRRAENPEARSATLAAYRSNNPEKIRAVRARQSVREAQIATRQVIAQMGLDCHD